jgi:hypothetical protein
MGLNTARFRLSVNRVSSRNGLKDRGLFDKIRNLKDKKRKRAKLKVKRT